MKFREFITRSISLKDYSDLLDRQKSFVANSVYRALDSAWFPVPKGTEVCILPESKNKIYIFL